MVPRMLSMAAIALAALAASAAQAATDKGLPASGSPLALEPTRAGYETSFDVAAEEAYEDVKLGPADPRLAGRLSVEALKSQQTPGGVKRVVVRVKGGDLRQGTFWLTMLAVRAGSKGSVERDVSLVVAPATLDPPQALVIRRVCDGLVVRGDCYGAALRADTNRPQLWESTQRQWLTGIRLVQKGDTDAGGQPAGILQVLKAPADAAPGTAPRIDYGTHVKLLGAFPLGTSKGKLVVQADQLAAPVAMDFEVQSRTTRWVLVGVLFLGLVLGYVTRRVLTVRLELVQEQQKTYALIQLIDATLARTADAPLRVALADLRGQAQQALAAKTADEIKTKTAAAQNAFLEQQDAIRARRAAMNQAIADVQGVLRARWKVAAPLADSLAKAIASVDTIAAGRATNDFTREADELDGAVMQALDAAQQDVTQGGVAADVVLRTVAQIGALLDAAGAEALRAQGKPSAAPARASPGDPFKAHLDALRKALEYVHTLRAWTTDACATSRTLLLAHAAAWESRLTAADLPQRKAWSDWLDTARQLAEQLDPAQVFSGNEAPLEAASSLVQRLGDVLRAQVASSDEAGIVALVEKSAYDAAVTSVARLRQPPAAPAVRSSALERRGVHDAVEEPPGGATTAATGTTGTTTMIVGRSALSLPHVAYGLAPAPADDAATIALLAAASQRRAGVTSGLLQVTYAAIIMAGGYFLLADKWIGTALDAAIAFFWAYATDIGADAATAAVRGLKK